MFAKLAATVAVAVPLVVAHAPQGRAQVLNRWVQFAPNDTVYLRAIEQTPANGCPAATVDGSPVTLAQRGAPTTGTDDARVQYPILMCEAQVTAFGHSSATIGGVSLKMPVANPQRILFIGDTGCRVTSATSGTQNCNDPQQFPLQFIANYAASFKPDLIVHVGDFFYREQPCPTGFSGCTGNPYFDNWASWYADWFGPAKNLLAAAPLALTRGNHESCNRGAHGWFRLLDPFPYNANAVNCTGQYSPMAGAPGTKTTTISHYDYSTPYVVKAGQVSLLMFDSSDSNTTAPDNTTRTMATDPSFPSMTLPQIYAAQLNAVLPPLKGTNVVFITHKASFDIRPAKVNGNFAGGDATQQSVFNGVTPNGGVPPQIRLIVSGHDHQFQVVNFADGRYAPQLVTGNSGTLLDNNSGTQPQTFAPDATPGNQGAAYALPGVTGTPTITIQSDADQSGIYGFTVMTAVSGGFIANAYNTASGKLARCAVQLSQRAMMCTQ